MLFWSTVSPAFLSVPVLVPGAAIKFINANFAADLAANDLISVWALPCVFGADCEVGAASVELLAVALLLALPCVSGEDCEVGAASVELLAVGYLHYLASLVNYWKF